MVSLTENDRVPLWPMAGRINSALERHYRQVTALFLLLFLACSVLGDMRFKLWVDELRTLYLAQQSGPAEIIKATMEGADGAPPIYPIIVSTITPIVRNEALATRLPSTLGFCGMLFFILAFCRRRLPATYAFIAALFACTSCFYYATEGRCYGMVLGCAAGALFCWQRATEAKPRALHVMLLAACLIMMVALHYYSIFFLVPLACAEAIRWLTMKKTDLVILGALASAIATIVVQYPLIQAGKIFRSHMWPPALAQWQQIPDFYLRSFSLIPICVCLVTLMAVGVVAQPLSMRNRNRIVFPLHELVAIGMLGLMPFVAVGIAKFTLHVFLYRYALWTVIGLAISTALILFAISCDQPLVSLSVMGLLLSILAGQYSIRFRNEAKLRDGEATRLALGTLPDDSRPIVISDVHAFAEISYYAEPCLRNRIVYPLDRGLDLQYKGFDTDSIILSALRPRTNLHIVDLNLFLKVTPQFILATKPDDYLPRYLLSAGYRLVPIRSGSGSILYEVQAPNG